MLERKQYTCLVIIVIIKTSAASFCTIRNDDSCYYTVKCDIPARINIVPYCEDTELYITLVINESPIHNVKANIFNTKFDAHVRILTAVGNSWAAVQNNAFSNFKNVLYIDLSDSQIKNIGKAFVGLKQLDSLNLSRNFLEVIKPEVFMLSENTTRLHLLDLSYNLLTYLPDNFFENLYNLRRLYLQGNKLIMLGDQYAENSKNLVYLNLCCSNYTTLNITLKNFSNLKELDLSFNQLKKVDIFELKFLETINLSHNILEELVFDDFERFPNLEQLDLSYNKLKKIFSSKSPQNDNRTKPLIDLYMNNNNITDIDETFFINFNFIRLLNLSYNNIREIGNGTFKYVKRMEYLSLSNCGLKLTNETFLGLNNTKIIDISRNNITTLNVMFFAQCRELDIIEADFNNISVVDEKGFRKLLPIPVKITLEGNPLDLIASTEISVITENRLFLPTADLIYDIYYYVIIFIVFSLLGVIFLILYFNISQNINYVTL